VVILGHAMGLDKSFSLAQAQLLHRAGYTVVLFDFRNHGASFRDHRLTRFSHRFDHDVVTVVDHVRAMPEHAHARIALWGFSFSTFPVLDTLARLDGAVHAVICDSGPTHDLSAIVNSLPRSGLLPLPQVLQAAPVRTLWQAVYQRLAVAILDAPAEWPPATQQVVSATPMLFVVGDRDAVAPVDQVVPWRVGTGMPSCWWCRAPGTCAPSRSTSTPTPPRCSTSSREYSASRSRRRSTEAGEPCASSVPVRSSAHGG
jgi:pimeloyl-ACP methyl ester carboxylesterase